MKQMVSHVAVAFLAALFSFLLFRQFYPSPAAPPMAAPVEARLVKHEPAAVFQPPAGSRTGVLSLDFVDVATAITDAVVNIAAFNAAGLPRSNGSGVICTADGYLITNHHVVADAGRLEVTLPSRRRAPARLIGADPTTDLALVKIEAHDLHPLPFGNSDLVEVGQWVLAVGNPFNLSSTVTAGIISAKARNLDIIQGTYSIESFIQTDAVVNPGNSGGALVNTKGELIGINTAILSESGGYEGYSFAIPANLVRKVVRDLLEHGAVQRAILGVGIREIDDVLAADLGLPAVEGVLVSGVTPGGSADLAGLQPGDVIVRVNEAPTATLPQLQEQVARFRPGDRISLEFFRQGRKYRRDNVLLQGLPPLAQSN